MTLVLIVLLLSQKLPDLNDGDGRDQWRRK